MDGAPGLEERLAKVEGSLAQPKRKDRWEKAQVVLGALTPLITGRNRFHPNSSE